VSVGKDEFSPEDEIGVDKGGCKADDAMVCLSGESEHKAKPGRYRCRRCGAVSKKKGHVCKPKRIKSLKPRKRQ